MKNIAGSLSRGYRRLTPAMVLARHEAESRSMSGASRSAILRALRQGRSMLKLTCQQVELLGFLASWTDDEDWDEDGTPISTARNRDIQDHFDLGRTRVKALLRELAEGGWILHRDSPNGQRYIRRLPGQTQPLYAYGIDLSPLSQRYEELEQAALAQKERRREGQRLHREVMRLIRGLYALLDLGQEQGLPGKDIQHYQTQLRQLAQLRGEDRNPEVLGALYDQLQALQSDLELKIMLLDDVESDPMGPAERPHYTTTNTQNLANATVNGIGFANNCNEVKRSRFDKPSLSSNQSSSPLRGFKAGPSFLLHIAPQLREFCSSSRPSETEMIDATLLACHQVGISRHAWKQGDTVFGSYANAVVLAVTLARLKAKEIRSPGGYYRSLIQRYLEGTLALDRTLYGLAERVTPEGQA